MKTIEVFSQPRISTAVDIERPSLTFSAVEQVSVPLAKFEGFDKNSAYAIELDGEQAKVVLLVVNEPPYFCFHVRRFGSNPDDWTTLLMDCRRPVFRFSEVVTESIRNWEHRREETRERRAMFAEQSADQASWQEGLQIQNTGRRNGYS